ncbi:MAG TPA: LysM peptidoglycan-binding domain-containing protein [Vicinamibacterales bacterium]
MVSVRRVAPFLFLVIALAIPATTALAQKQSSVPPKDLHRIGEHWTAYYPPDPATYPAGSKTHEIKAGDTLWALAQTYYGNSYLWPQLWESNTWITDAHWIYPGDILLVTGEAGDAAAAAGGANAEGAVADSGSGETGALSAVSPRSDLLTGQFGADQMTDSGIPIARIEAESRPLPLATESDIYCYGYIGHPDEPMPNFVQSHEAVDIKYVPRMRNKERPGSAAEGDLIYVSGGAESGLTAGETYVAVVPGQIVKHPATGEILGRHYQYAGQIRILCIEGNRSRAVVVQSCREIPIGARLKPLPQLPIPIARIPPMPQWCDPPSGRTAGYIVDSRGWGLGTSEGNLVQIDLGTNDEIEPGDFLTVWRPSERSDQPRQVIGQIGILTTQAETATAVIVQSKKEIVIGDQVEVR